VIQKEKSLIWKDLSKSGRTKFFNWRAIITAKITADGTATDIFFSINFFYFWKSLFGGQYKKWHFFYQNPHVVDKCFADKLWATAKIPQDYFYIFMKKPIFIAEFLKIIKFSRKNSSNKILLCCGKLVEFNNFIVNFFGIYFSWKTIFFDLLYDKILII
jgi:hypothetical protein